MEGAKPSRPRPRRGLAWGASALWLATALGPLGCSTYIGTTATSFLHRVRDDPDPNIRYLAYAKLASPHCYDSEQQKAEAVKVLISKLGQGVEPTADRKSTRLNSSHLG